MSTTLIETCTRCKGINTYREDASYGMIARTCRDCDYTEVLTSKPMKQVRRRRAKEVTPAGQLGLFGVRKTRPVKEELPEETVQRNTINELTRLGFRVLQTTVRYKWQTCPKCLHKHRPDGGYGATPGVTDLLVCEDWWPLPLQLAVEVKGTKTEVSEAQKELRAKGRIVVIRHWDEAVKVALQVREVMRLLLDTLSLPTEGPEDTQTGEGG